MGSLAWVIGHAFTDAAKRRGEHYARSGRVHVVSVGDGLVEALVQGTEEYEVTIRTGDGGCDASCTCPASFDGLCKHIWALVLVCERDGLLRRGPPRLRPREPKWRERLREIARYAPGEGRPDPAPQRNESRFVYALDVDATLANGGDPAVDVFRQTRGASGEWGEPRISRATYRRDVPAEDRGLLLHLSMLGSWQFGYAPADSPRATSLLLPALCATGRFFLLRDGRFAEEPLAHDQGGPWVFGLEFEPEGDACVVRGYLERGGERVPIEEPVLLHDSGWVFFEGVAARLDTRGAMGWIVELRRGGPLRLPRAEMRAALEKIVSLPSRPLLSGAGAPPAVTGSPRPRLRLHDRGDAELEGEIAFDYGAARIGAFDASATLLGGMELVDRDREAEAKALRRLVNEGVGLRAGVAHVPRRKLAQVARALVGDGWTVEADGRPYRAGGGFRMNVRSGIDWFELEGAMDFGGEAVALPALLEAARTGTVRLGDGSTGVLPEDWLARWGFLEKSGLKFTKAQGFFLDALLADRSEVDVDARFAELRRRLASFEGIRPAQEGEGFRGTLRPYQREALGWFAFLREMGLSGCLADDMGLGKTVQVLAMLAGRRGSKPSLVVAPKSVVPNWVAEAKRFAPQLRVLDYTGPSRRERVLAGWDLVVTSYGTLRQDAADLADVAFDYSILDEAQMIKNPRAVCSKAARLLRADHRLALTGTPVENHLGDLWSILDFLNPGMAPRVEAFRALGGDDRLGRALRPFFLRRTKEQVLKDLPEKSEQILWCDLDGKQRKAYDEVRDHYRASLLAKGQGDLKRMKIHVLEALLRLRQVACHHGLVDPARAAEPCAKLATLLPLLDEVIAEGHRALVFSQFTSFLAILRKELDAKGIGYEYLDGQTRRRDEIVARFQSGERPLFLVSLKAGGFGLNLTAADYVFLLDPWWNPAVETQAIDRTHRIGQTRKVMAYRMIGRGTVEERVLELQASKRALAEAVLAGDDRTLLEGLTREDLELLLS